MLKTDKAPNKEYFSIRITKYELDRARIIAEHLKMKVTEYLEIAIHDQNEHYEEKIHRGII